MENKMNDFIEKWWISDKAAGIIKKKFYTILQKKYGFADWHLEPINFRPYAQEVVSGIGRYINKQEIKSVVEVGCGLGDIIGNIKTVSDKKCEKIGIDMEENVLKGARFLHPSTTFLQGSFDNVRDWDGVCLIMVNFIHGIPYDVLQQEVYGLLKSNHINMFVIDTFCNNKGTEYVYSHKGMELFLGRYKLLKRSAGFPCAHGARRYIEYWQRQEEIIQE